MNLTIYPNKLKGTITAIPSKSQAHRLLICAAFSDCPTEIICWDTNQDIDATVGCLNALGAQIKRTDRGYNVIPVQKIPASAYIDCRESGSTLRFILPIVCALGIETTIQMSGRLPYRPLSPMWEELERMGCKLTRPTETSIQTFGKLRSGTYTIAGDISSQFITGLLFALSLTDGESRIIVTGNLESRPYVEMTQKALSQFGVNTEAFCVGTSFPFHSPGYVEVEGDWSNGAFFLVANALGSNIAVANLDRKTAQGDRAVADILASKASNPTINAANIPDLVPILAVHFAAKGGATFTNISRLRLKESDRVVSVSKLLLNLGIQTVSDEDTLTVNGGVFTGGTVDACGDHRIAMAAGIAATAACGPVTILGAECVAKSYPNFWQEYKKLGGKYEQYIR